jgi:ElaB/YqjD/DUF883 family membrane-anchored ribosome-binding protein
MADQNELPEGTDTVISGAAVTSENEEQLIVAEPTKRDRVLEKVREGRGKLAGQAADKTRGLVGQGLERGSEALANVSKLVGDTAAGLDERLGEEYGDYARRAAGAIEDVANNLASKDADELIDDTRNFVRKSPGVALAGAAIVGFALARLVKSGFDDARGQSRGNGGRGGGGGRKRGDNA